MAGDDFQRGACNERTGFLFKHACSSPAADTCDRCQKPVCAEHSHQIDAELLCSSCGKTQLRQNRRRERGAIAGRRGYDDPYFYDDHYYSGYGRNRHGWGRSHYYGSHHHHHDENDFTEADSESLVHEGDETFEEDMGES